uniref:DNA-directed DNA polymerase n=1 Tax=Strongyloides venezuelensis TaxID=75913 RepID=A0A0K0EVT8_STRVS
MARLTKYQRFISEPMSGKKISEVPGIGNETAKKFESVDITKAIQLYLLYKIKKMNDRVFINFLINYVGMSSRYAIQCTKSLSEYDKCHEDVEELDHEFREFVPQVRKIWRQFYFYFDFFYIF